MSRTKFIALIVCFGLLLMVGAAQAQTPVPSTDLLFAALRAEPKGAILVRVDTESWTTTLFHADTELLIGRIVPLHWSPDGQSLAVLRYVIPDPNDLHNHFWQVCVLSRTGVLIRCMDEPAWFAPNHHGESQAQALTWSADSTKLYYVAADAEREVLRFVEAEARTGRTLRVLSEYVGAQLVWSPTLDYRVEVRWQETLGMERLSIEYQRLTPAPQSAQRTDLSSQFVSSGYFYRLCPDTSPSGTYFVALGGLNWEDRFILLNRQGQVTKRLAFPIARDAENTSCPSWQPDEQAFYFRAKSLTDPLAYIFRYSLPDEQLTIFYRFPERLHGMDYPDYRVDYPAYGGSISGVRVSPDGRFVAAMGMERAIITYPPEGERILVGWEYAEASDPLWFPPEQ